MKNIALILLGGRGKRFGGDIPKQFLKRNDIPIYIDAIRKYEGVPLISDILLVVNKDYIDEVKSDLNKYNIHKVVDVIPGGKERFISSYLGIKYLANHYNIDDNVLIADAVRPAPQPQVRSAPQPQVRPAKPVRLAAPQARVVQPARPAQTARPAPQAKPTAQPTKK